MSSAAQPSPSWALLPGAIDSGSQHLSVEDTQVAARIAHGPNSLLATSQGLFAPASDKPDPRNDNHLLGTG